MFMCYNFVCFFLIRKSRDMECVEPHWMEFIGDNLLAYTLIFQQLLSRFARVDLASPKNAHMFYRVIKVNFEAVPLYSSKA